MTSKHAGSVLPAQRTPLRRKVRDESESGYWILDASPRFYWKNVTWVNDPNEDLSYGFYPNGNPIVARNHIGGGRGFGFLGGKPTPRLRVSYKQAAQLGDAAYFAGSAYLLCSRRLAEFFQKLQPDNVEILPIEIELKGGEVVPAGEYVFLDVTLRVPAIDYKAMGRTIVDDRGHRYYAPNLEPPYKLRNDIPSSASLFRDDIVSVPLFAADAVREACREEGLSRRLYWGDPTKLY